MAESQRVGDLLSPDLEKGNRQVSDVDDATIIGDETGPEDTDVVADKEEAASEGDPNLVFWDGPDDPENPMNWPEAKKWINIGVLSILTIIT
jgi:hypothetical protein